jgi:hypothetical protein
MRVTLSLEKDSDCSVFLPKRLLFPVLNPGDLSPRFIGSGAASWYGIWTIPPTGFVSLLRSQTGRA